MKNILIVFLILLSVTLGFFTYKYNREARKYSVSENNFFNQSLKNEDNKIWLSSCLNKLDSEIIAFNNHSLSQLQTSFDLCN